MIRLPDDIYPNKEILDKLQEYQKLIDVLQNYQEEVTQAKSLFTQKNKKGNKVFNIVKEKLTEMCAGARRCIYCEDSMSDEIEHILPKSLYPNKCFDWNNYIYICGICNVQKNNKFAIFLKDNRTVSIIDAKKAQNLKSYPVGKPVLINPRMENAMDFCMLDLSGTFKFVIIVPENTPEYKRADYTINVVLRLNNQREFLRQARENAYGNYKARLFEYNHRKQKGESADILTKIIRGIQSESHPTVWKEMQRYHRLNILSKVDKDLEGLFLDSPEAIDW